MTSQTHKPNRRVYLQKSRKQSFRSSITNPSVLVAIVTTVFGTLAVSIISNTIKDKEIEVSSKEAELQLQFEVIQSIMAFTKSAELDSSRDILKLKAYTMLINDNEELKVKLKGFQDIIDDFYIDRLLQAEDSISELSLKIEDNVAFQENLRKSIDNKERQMRQLAASNSKEKEKLQGEIDVSRNLLAESEQKSKEIQDELKLKLESIEAAKIKLEESMGVEISNLEKKLTSEKLVNLQISQDNKVKDSLIAEHTSKIQSLNEMVITMTIEKGDLQSSEEMLIDSLKTLSNQLNTEKEIVTQLKHFRDSIMNLVNEKVITSINSNSNQ